jgi:1,4-alpha-glucan branching enzyme
VSRIIFGNRDFSGVDQIDGRGEPALHRHDCDPAGFEWVDCCDTEQSVVSLLRKGRSPADAVVFVCNFTPVQRHNYRIGVNEGGRWLEKTTAAVIAPGRATVLREKGWSPFGVSF